jgi:hypothetical protein
MLKVRCNHCNKGYRVDVSKVGKQARCANLECGKMFMVAADHPLPPPIPQRPEALSVALLPSESGHPEALEQSTPVIPAAQPVILKTGTMVASLIVPGFGHWIAFGGYHGRAWFLSWLIFGWGLCLFRVGWIREPHGSVE